MPSPSAAVATASTMPAGPSVEVVADEVARSAGRGAGVGGHPVAVLAGEHPRPSGDQGSTPSPSAGRGRHHLALDAALQQRVLDLGRPQRRPARPGRLPASRPGGLPAGVVRHPDVAGPARVTATSSADRVSSSGDAASPGVQLPEVDVVDAEPAQRPSSGAAARRGRRRAPRPVRPGDAALSASTSRRAVPRSRAAGRAAARSRRRRTTAAVSSRVPPASRKACSWPPRRPRRCRGPRSSCPGPSRRPAGRCGPTCAAPWPTTYRRRTAAPRSAPHAGGDRARHVRLRRHELGLNLGYWGAGNDADNLALAREADRLGYAVVWAAEAYGSDAATVLTWVAGRRPSGSTSAAR